MVDLLILWCFPLQTQMLSCLIFSCYFLWVLVWVVSPSDVLFPLQILCCFLSKWCDVSFSHFVLFILQILCCFLFECSHACCFLFRCCAVSSLDVWMLCCVLFKLCAVFCIHIHPGCCSHSWIMVFFIFFEGVNKFYCFCHKVQIFKPTTWSLLHGP